MRPLWILAAWPLVEIALFVMIGGRIGFLATMGVILASGLLGGAVLRGLGQRRPGGALLAGEQILTVLAAILLILPGFLGDGLGLLLLIRPLRLVLIGWGAAQLAMRFGPMRRASGQWAGAEVIEADYTVLTPGRPRGDSPWNGRD